MFKKVGFIVATSLFVVLSGCGGAGNLVNQVISPFAGGYSGTMTFTATSTDEPFAFTVNTNGVANGRFTDPDLGPGTFNGTVHDDGSSSGTLFANTTFGTYVFTMSAGAGSTYTGTGSIKPGSTTKPITFTVTKA